MGVPQNHPKAEHFSVETHGGLGIPEFKRNLHPP